MQQPSESTVPSSVNMSGKSASASAAVEGSPHVLIIGAGITGLVLAQAIRKRNETNPPITFSIYERDADPLARGAGWGLTLHWALGQFISLLPQSLIDRLNEPSADEDAAARGERGNFKLFNLQTGEDDFMTPAGDSPRHRFAREKLRRLLMDGLEIQVCLIRSELLCGRH
jgi:2-polyprenyl-6-methoxyphenol hydroxylase-like FAD-dependent oxidoreductase